MAKLYRQAKLTDDQEDKFVFPHKMAMTGEKLHSKSEIAYELGARDKRIAELEKDNELLKEVEVIFNNAPDLVFADCKGYFPEEFKAHSLEQQKKVIDILYKAGKCDADCLKYFEALKDNT